MPDLEPERDAIPPAPAGYTWGAMTRVGDYHLWPGQGRELRAVCGLPWRQRWHEPGGLPLRRLNTCTECLAWVRQQASAG